MRVGDKPAWITEAEKYIGEKEIPGKGNNPLILQWWKAIKRGGIKLDSVPWCAGFAGAMMENAGFVSTRFESAKSYLQWGVTLTAPKFGCVVVFERDGGGHVGFVVGKTADGRLLVLGGNQADKVSIAPFKTERVAGYRWPKNIPFSKHELPVMANTDPTSTNEA